MAEFVVVVNTVEIVEVDFGPVPVVMVMVVDISVAVDKDYYCLAVAC